MNDDLPLKGKGENSNSQSSALSSVLFSFYWIWDGELKNILNKFQIVLLGELIPQSYVVQERWKRCECRYTP